MNFINNEKLHKFNISSFSRFSCYNIPFFRCSNYDLSLINLLSSKMSITSQFSNSNTIVGKSSLEISNNFCNKCFHWCNINDFKRSSIKSVIWPSSLIETLKNCKHSYISFTSTSRCTNKQIFWWFKGSLVQLWLNCV